MTTQPDLTEKLPTWRFNLTTIRFALRPFLIHSAFTLVTFFKDALPGLIVKFIFDSITQAAGAPSAPAPFLGVSPLWWAVGGYVLIGVAQVALGIGYEWYGWTFRSLVAMALTGNLFASILRRRGDQTLPISAGEAVNRFHADVAEVADFPLWLPDQAGKWIAAIFAVIIMARINLTITLVIFAPLLGIMFITRLAWKGIQKYAWESTRSADRVEGFLGETFGAVQAVKVADAEESVVAHFLALNEQRQKAQMRLALAWGLLNSLNQGVVAFGIGVMLLMAGQAIAGGSFTIGDFALFVSYLGFTTQVPSELGTFYGDYKKQEISIERLLEMIHPEPSARLLETHPTYADGPLPEVPVPVKTPSDVLETLEVRDLAYQYPQENGSPGAHAGGIDHISFSLRRGELVVITGRIASGKSTLLRILLGLIPAQAGAVFWNGQMVSDPAFFRPPRCAYTSQVPRLFSETLRDNLLMGLPEAAVDLPGALRLAVLEPDLLALENGLDTLVGPRGVRLSGGQVQRAAAARMAVRAPELMVFDDLSSALDVETERTFWERLKAARVERGLTCLAVSHRKAGLLNADRIVLLSHGTLEAEGRLDDLLKTSEEMRAIWRGEMG